jgi:hypothetical protein
MTHGADILESARLQLAYRAITSIRRLGSSTRRSSHPFRATCQRKARKPQVAQLSDNAFELDFLGNTFVRFIRALDAIQPFLALDRE